MLSDVDKRLKVICSLVMLAAIAFMPLAGMSDLQAQEDDTFHLSPLNPDFVKFFEEPPDPFYGYIPPPMDLSHLDEIPVERPQKATSLPGSFDWRDTGKVTPIKNQNPCGTCWVHGTLAALESKVLIEESTTCDFSEQNLDCCTDPAWVYLIGNRCNGGGWSWLAGDTLTKKGSRLEACQPYNTSTINTEACDDSCQSIKMVTDYRMIANEATSPDTIEPIKNAIYNHGPLAMSYAADDGTHMYPGSIYYWPDCPANEVNHLVCIVGWDGTVAHPADGGSGAWIVKNSWGTGWGDNGYFYLCYGSAGMCEVASLDYKDYDCNEQVYYLDEAGNIANLGNWEDYAGWMANIFTSTQDGELTHVDFWTTSNSAQYEIYVYLDGDISDGLQDLATSQSGTCQEFGYYSIPLSSPVSVNNGQSFISVVKMTTPGYKYPIPVEYQSTGLVDPPIQTGKSFFRHGDGESWIDTATLDCNACLRARVTSGAANNPPYTPSNPSPANHATGVSVNADLSWTGGDPDAGDTVTYDVYFGTSSTPPLVSNDQSGTTYDPGTLAYNTKYYWKIIAADNHAASTTGPLWDFTTQTPANNPPDTPSSPSPANHATGASINADLSWTGGDPDAAGDTVTYDVYFGTSSTPPLVSNDQSGTTYDPGTLAYNTKYYWKIIATDNHAASTTGPLWDFTTAPASNNPPQLSNPSVQPSSGTPATDFYYYVNYFDSDGDSPSVMQVYIDSSAYTMSLYSGSASNGVYRYGPKNLSVGWGHNYYFYFEDGNGGIARLPSSGAYSGPTISDGEWDPWDYDENSDSIIQKGEVLKALQDYFAELITKAQVLEVLQLYFS